MCGIAGEIRFDGAAADLATVRAMAAAQISRGPDSGDVYQRGPVAFGHRRLKIIDLSARASQPMVDDATGLVIVFNGCIYNHVELRRELERLGHAFLTTSDTEVILKAYAEWGSGCVERFNGMFAFAIHERETGRAFLARDRLGIKPFYYSESASTFRFASTLPALLVAGDVDTTIDPVALHQYMSFHSIVPAPRTILKGIKKLPPATRMFIEPTGERRSECYWQPAFQRSDEIAKDLPGLKEQVLHAIGQAVQRRMVADVPVGVLLSGGVDSSLVVGLLAQQGQANLETFTIGFESSGGEAGNEFPYSDLIAQTFGTTHHKLDIDAERLVEHLPGCFNAMSEPMVSHDNIAFYLLSREVSKHVKVVQSGQGADEIFGGYFWYPPLLDSVDPVADYSREFFDRDHADMARILNPDLLDRDFSAEFVAHHFANANARTAVDKALHIDSTVMLIDDPVKRVDNMTMAFGLEARVPFLDHELVELAAAIPPELKVGGTGKYILKEAARKVIPNEVIDRKKGYFPVPQLKYLEGPSLDYVKAALHDPQARQRGLFRQAYLDELLADPARHITPLGGSKLWQLAALEIWLQAHHIH